MARRFHFNRNNSPIAGACAGVLFGLLFAGAAFPLLWWNEGRAVKRYKTLKEGEGIVVSIDPLEVDDKRDGALVHLTAEATTDETLNDGVFGVSINAIRLDRVGELYQWEEREQEDTHTDSDGNTTTTTSYSYSKTWASRVIDSDAFDRPHGHENPKSMPYDSRTIKANVVTVGEFILSPNLVAKISNSVTLPLEAIASPPNGFKRHDGMLYLSDVPASPRIGDFRVGFSAVLPQEVSVVAGQFGVRLDAYTTTVGGRIELLQEGAHTAHAMFAREHKINTAITWAIRAGGTLGMFLGFLMLFGPISALTSRIPGLRTIVNAGVGLVSFGLAVSFSMLTISIGWLAYRPTLGWILAGIAVALFVALYLRGRRNERATAH